jgi:hypothetical protein
VLAAWALHAGLDWDWEMPALTLMGLLLAAAAVAWSETGEFLVRGAVAVDQARRSDDVHLQLRPASERIC